MSKVSRHMTRDDLVKYLRQHQISISEFYDLLGSWFNLTWDERKGLIDQTGFYRSLKRSK